MELNVFIMNTTFVQVHRPLIQNKNIIQSITCQMVLSGTPYDPITTFFFLKQKVHIGENTQKK